MPAERQGAAVPERPDLLADLIAVGISTEESEAKVRKTEIQAREDRKHVKSIAVLPLKDMSPQQDQTYLCQGLAEELINALTQVKGLKVAARTSSFSFQDKETDIREIGSTLNVAPFWKGAFRKRETACVSQLSLSLFPMAIISGRNVLTGVQMTSLPFRMRYP